VKHTREKNKDHVSGTERTSFLACPPHSLLAKRRRPTCSQLHDGRNHPFFLFSLFYSILSFFSFLLILTAEKIRRSCDGTSKSEQRKCSACKYSNCTIHLFLFSFSSCFLFLFSRYIFFLPSRSKNLKVPRC